MDNNQREYRTVIVHGPAASGKTRHGADIARALGCKDIIDDFVPLPGADIRPGALHLTNVQPLPGTVPECVLILPIESALAAAFVEGSI